MNQTLTLPSQVYRKLAKGATERGMTLESLLAALSELVAVPDEPTGHDRQRCERVENLLERLREGRLEAKDRGELDQLIDADYHAANARADRLIRAKERRPRNG